MNNLTQMERQFIEELFAQAYGGTIFTSDINPEGWDKAQKSGVVSSLVQKNILVIPEDGMIGLPQEDDEVEYEVTRVGIEERLKRL